MKPKANTGGQGLGTKGLGTKGLREANSSRGPYCSDLEVEDA
jgi:hypothetical protein